MKTKRYWILTLLILLTFNIKSYSQKQGSLKSIMLIIDSSGSMQGVKMDSVKTAAKRIIKMLLPCNTEFAILGFTGDKVYPVPFRMDFSQDINKLYSFIDGLKPWGGTRIGDALKVGNLIFQNHMKMVKSSKQAIILLSDGLSDDNVIQAVKEIRLHKPYLAIDCIGYDLNKEKMAEDQLRQVASQTGGEYYQVTDVSKVGKAFIKSSLKVLVHDAPVSVRIFKDVPNFKIKSTDLYKSLVMQNWVLDSIQINVAESVYDMAESITSMNLQDTMPKMIVFDEVKKASLFINNINNGRIYTRWLTGDFAFSDNTFSLIINHYYFKFMIKSIDNNGMILCLNKFKFIIENANEPKDELCDCGTTVSEMNPYILVYFSKAGCE
jgi:uncharacterized protein YegL